MAVIGRLRMQHDDMSSFLRGQVLNDYDAATVELHAEETERDGYNFLNRHGQWQRYYRPILAVPECKVCRGLGIVPSPTSGIYIGAIQVFDPPMSFRNRVASECDQCLGTGHGTPYHLGGCI